MNKKPSILRGALWKAVSSVEQAADDKISLQDQDREEREWAASQGINIVAVLSVPGHSRWESDPIIALEEFARDGIFAYHELRDLWQKRAFDVLICYNHSRLGRSFTMQSWVIENVIRSGARVYRIQGGWIDSTDYLPQIAMGGMSSVSDVDRLVKSRRSAMIDRAKRGLPTSSNIMWSHKVIRDEYGRAIKTVVDEDKRRLFDDLAALLLEGVGWQDIEHELYERFGHVKADGKPFTRLSMYRSVYHPWFWGNSARYFNDQSGPNKQKRDDWAFDESIPAPEGTLVFYNTHEPVWAGELAEKVKAELRRRRTSIRGKARPTRTHRFSGLLICGECLYFLGYNGTKNRWMGMGCVSRYNQNARLSGRHQCQQRRMIAEPRIQAYVDELLRQMIEADNLDLIYTQQPEEDKSKRVEQLAHEVAATEEQARRLIVKQATAPDDLQSLYDEQVAQVGALLKTLRVNLTEARYQQAAADHSDQQAALSEIATLSLEHFWNLSETEINQILHRLVGKRRFVLMEGEIIGTANAPHPQPRNQTIGN